MKIYNILVKKREKIGKSVKELRQAKIVPGVIYGPEIKENINIQVEGNVLQKLYSEAGENSLINVKIDGQDETYEALIKEVELDPVLMTISHVDFYKIKRGQKIETTVDLEFEGESPALKEFNSTFLSPISEVRIKCLPKDLLSEIKVDVSVLKTLDDVIYVKDLKVPEGIEILEDMNAPVALVEEVVIEEEPITAPEAEMPEVEGGEKNDGEAKPEDVQAKTEAEEKSEK